MPPTTRIPHSDLRTLLILSFVGALLSVLVMGFVFGITNNSYHLPIVASLYDEPQFADDPFIQSLRYYASGIWLTLKGSAHYADPYWVFLIANYLSRVIAYAGLLSCAELLGIKTLRQRCLFILILSFTGLLYGESYAGGGGLFLIYFTHSEIANGVSLLALSFIIRQRFILSYATNGVAFFINAFIGVWNFAPLALLSLHAYAKKTVTFKKLLTCAAIGGVIFLAIATPVLMNISSNPDFGKTLSFSYVEYLKQYWPYHMIFSVTSFKQKLAAGLILTIAFVSFAKLGPQARVFTIALIGYVIVFILGIIAPHLTENPVVINLHLLRVSSFFHFFAALGAITLAVKWLEHDDLYYRHVLGPVLVVLLCAQKLVLATGLFLLFVSLAMVRHLVPTFLAKRSAQFASLVGVFLVLWQSYVVLDNDAMNAEKKRQISEFSAIGNWAKTNTPQDAVFLIMTVDTRPWGVPGRKFIKPDFISVIFQYASHRRLWVDFKDGAAVMWMPSYYTTWYSRITEVLALRSLQDKKAYAQKHGIAYIIDYCNVTDSEPLYKAEKICLYSAL